MNYPHFSKISSASTPVLLLLASALSAACGGPSPSSQAAFSGTKFEKPTTVAGEVRAHKQVVKTGRLEVADYKGSPVASTRWDNSPKFSVEIPAGTSYPLVLSAYPETGEAGKEPLKLAITKPGPDYQINSATTRIAKKAQEMGCYTPENITQAAVDTAVPPDAAEIGGGSGGHDGGH
jgi:hypothetical protein